MADKGYTYKKLDTPKEDLELHQIPPKPPDPSTEEQFGPEELSLHRDFAKPWTTNRTIVFAMAGLMLIAVLALIAVVRSAVLEPRAPATSSTEDVPQYFQTTPEIFAGKFPIFRSSIGRG